MHHSAVLPWRDYLQQETFLICAFATEAIFLIRKTRSIVGLVLVLALQLSFEICTRTRTRRRGLMGVPGVTNKACFF
jgi:hypothetical protein